ncbi:MAG: hypothetical protein MR935_08080 [Agathobaculum sp.]|uniref:hypothetical protein n=1 Tax=Agathobaculum sp. TaxID=2048138 RepID=UPI0025C05656|nr:hypothetical protein [Agathobaculum sp.]MCI7126131.1 hypothetical protein [Agathobaculum sp.]MDY3711934.1 hypothetical protein [Agathobaculum sp.]
MKLRKHVSTPLLAAIGAGVLVAILFVSYLLSSGLLHERGTGIVLPEKTGSAPVASGDSQLLTAQSVAEVEIGPHNAQQIIASLKRPAAYSCRIENTLYYSGGSSTLACRLYASGQTVRTDTLDADGTAQSVLMRSGDAVYAWNTGDTTAYQGKWGDFSEDAAAMLPTYEDVLREDVTLTDAGREDVEQVPCIRAAFEQGGYRCVYYISAVSGLLQAASFYNGDQLTRRVSVSALTTEAPDETVFTLPDGRAVGGE